MLDKKYGKKFKQLRKQKNFSLDMASDGITSKSSLYYWEKGQKNMAIDKVLAMLERMHIKYDEFATDENHFYIDIEDVKTAYQDNDNHKLKQIAVNSISLFNHNPYIKKNLIKAAIACNFLKDSTEEILLSSKNQAYLQELLSEITEWNYEDVFIFGNTLSLLPAKRTYGLTKLLLNKIINNCATESTKWNHSALNTVINASFSLIDDVYYFKKTICKLDDLKLDDSFAYEKIRLVFVFELGKYIETNDASAIEEKFFPCLDYLGYNQLSQGMKQTFYKLRTSRHK